MFFAWSCFWFISHFCYAFLLPDFVLPKQSNLWLVMVGAKMKNISKPNIWKNLIKLLQELLWVDWKEQLPKCEIRKWDSLRGFWSSTWASPSLFSFLSCFDSLLVRTTIDFHFSNYIWFTIGAKMKERKRCHTRNPHAWAQPNKAHRLQKARVKLSVVGPFYFWLQLNLWFIPLGINQVLFYFTVFTSCWSSDRLGHFTLKTFGHYKRKKAATLDSSESERERERCTISVFELSHFWKASKFRELRVYFLFLVHLIFFFFIWDLSVLGRFGLSDFFVFHFLIINFIQVISSDECRLVKSNYLNFSVFMIMLFSIMLFFYLIGNP